MKRGSKSIKVQPNDKDFGMAHYSDGALSQLTADHVYNHSSDFTQMLTVTWFQRRDACMEQISRYCANFWGRVYFNKESVCANTLNNDGL